jgi:hypothetical protein
MVDWCLDGFPQIIGIKGELADAARQGRPFNTAHIDFCGGLSVDNVLTTATVCAAAYTHPALIAVTMLKGREHKGASGLLNGVPRHVRRRLMLNARKRGNSFAQHIFSNRRYDPRFLLKLEEARTKESLEQHLNWQRAGQHVRGSNLLMKKNGQLGPMALGMIRATTMARSVECVWEAWELEKAMGLPHENLCIQVVGAMSYHSGTEKGGGTPFVTTILMVYRSSQWPLIEQALTSPEGAAACPYRSFTLKNGIDILKPTVAAMARQWDHKRVAEMFDIPVTSIPAIIAHDTRGSYAETSMLKFTPVTNAPEIEDLGWGQGIASVFPSPSGRTGH